MSLEDFAQHTGMDLRQVRRLADRGELPGQKIGGQWRFNRAEVTEWLQQEMPSFDERRLITLEQAMGGEASGMTVTELIGLEGIDIALGANTRASVLRELVNLAERTGRLYDAKGLLEAVQEREAMCSTALPHGVAIPHPRQPMPYISSEPIICVARLTRGIGFGSPYRDLTQLFFLICCHDDRHHLRVLARLVRLLDEGTINRIMEVDTPEALLACLIDKENQVIAQSQ
jgi:PTS system nitrogen regulatory IIA component